MIRITSIKIDDQETQKVINTLRSGKLVQGAVVEQLESSLAKYIGVKHVLAVNTGTAALHTALHAVGVEPGDEVITSPFSFVATANAIMMCGAVPVFADINQDTFNIDVESVEKLVTEKTKAILIVDLYGNPADYDDLLKICSKNNVKLVADSCQSIGASFQNKKIGSLADATAFSFYATKNIFAGEGGAVATNDDEIARKIRLFRNHGQTNQYEYESLGYNYRLTDVLASIVANQVADIAALTDKRRQNALALSAGLKDVAGLILPTEGLQTTHAFHQYTIRVTSEFSLTRDELRTFLSVNQIESKVYYPSLLSEVSHVAEQSRLTNTPIAHKISQEVLSIPVHQHLSETDIGTIIKTIKSASKTR